jgi:integrase
VDGTADPWLRLPFTWPPTRPTPSPACFGKPRSGPRHPTLRGIRGGRNEFRRLSNRAGVKTIVLHEGRHAALSLMEKAGMPISIVSKWAGHYDTAFTYSPYVHASDEDLKTGTDALGKIYKLK